MAPHEEEASEHIAAGIKRQRSASPQTSTSAPIGAQMPRRKHRESIEDFLQRRRDWYETAEGQEYRKMRDKEMEESRKRWDREAEERHQEEERRTSLTKEQRLVENGQKLLSELEDNPAINMFLEDSGGRARCYAYEDCLLADKGPRIVERYRVLVEAPREESWPPGPKKEYYHLMCMEGMLDLPSLAPTRFTWDSNRLGLMVKAWFNHSGRIDPDKIVEFIDAVHAYEGEDRKRRAKTPKDGSPESPPTESVVRHRSQFLATTSQTMIRSALCLKC
ncbi:hypothetical protein NA57DRAFT_77091 [Rhizodiscina lignyota]|uniref:Uncharacterized protein n=1 Tax=Rhizodiscina lignyota TaxID=1504668 RepID=A0A9P4IEQ9_9PEZI|nr:hypothetical protein NA57DRAFT_77091 [Rhizodiscina lignyota]